jgi:hypothetical protein
MLLFILLIFLIISAPSNMSLHSRVIDGAIFSDTSADEMSEQKL